METIGTTSISKSRNPEARKPHYDLLRLATAHLHQCRLLLAELDVFQACFARQTHNRKQMEMRSLRSNVVSEQKTLERLVKVATDLVSLSSSSSSSKVTICEGHNDIDKTKSSDVVDVTEEVAGEQEQRRLMHTLRSSNLPFYLAVWTIAKERCRAVTAFGKRFYWDNEPKLAEESKNPHTRQGRNKKSALVDIVANDGQEWIKISTVSQSRLLFEMAEKGWGIDDDDDSIENDEERTILRNEDMGDSDDHDELELIRLALDMTKAAKSKRVKYRHPRVRFVFTRLHEGEIPAIDNMLNKIRAIGVQVECGTPIPDILSNDASDSRPPESITPDDLPITNLIPNPFDKFTQTINVDCTLLLALVSDLSHHLHIDPYPSMHGAILRQIESEKLHPLVVSDIWPAVSKRNLRCTKESAQRMREIVDTIGTETEKERTAIIMGDLTVNGWSRQQLLQRFQELSDHEVPTQWMLPIKVLDVRSVIEESWLNGQLPSVARQIAQNLSDINQSVFLYGWAAGITTITSNRAVVRQIESQIEENRNDDDDLKGPHVWVCDTARSLVAKDKNRKE